MIFKISFVLFLTICAVFATSEKETGQPPQLDTPYSPGFGHGYPISNGAPPYFGPPYYNPYASNPYFGSPISDFYRGQFGSGMGRFGGSGSSFGPPPGKMFGPPPGTMFGPPPGTIFGPPPGTVFGPPPGTVFGPPPGKIPPGKIPPGKVFGPPPGTYFGPYGRYPFWNNPGYGAFHPAANDEEIY